MSRSKDRARAESGIIFRDGQLVRKEEWYAAHPTREMKAQTQAQVDDAVAELMAEKELRKGKQFRTAAANGKFSYFCSKCNHRHTEGTKICTDHRSFAQTPVTLRKEEA
jgi:hypothetical protein